MLKAFFLATLLLFHSPLALAADSLCTLLKEKPNLRLEECGRVKVLTLRGTPVERARAHGELIGKELSRDLVDYFSEKLFSALGNSPRPVQWLAKKIYGRWVERLHTPLAPALREELHAFGAGIGFSNAEVDRAIVLPDTAAFLNGLLSYSWTRWLPPLGCTSAAIRVGADGFVYGRNLDFASTTLWDRHPLITIQIPPAESAGELRHITFGADGVQYGGITGVNEAGISFSVHQNYTRGQHTGGIPMFMVGELVLRSARSLAEAEDILRVARPSPIFTFVVTDLKTREVMAVESSVEKFVVRRMGTDGKFAQSNHLINRETQPFQFIPHGVYMNSLERYRRALSLLNDWNQSAGASLQMAKLLAYSGSAKGELNAQSDIIKAHTIQSVILERKSAKDWQLHLSAGDAPTSSGPYARFRLQDLFKAGVAPTRYQSVDLTATPASAREFQMRFARALAAYFDHHDYQEAWELMRGQESLNARLLKIVLLEWMNKSEDALSLAQETLRQARLNVEVPRLRQSLRFAYFALLKKSGRQAEALAQAEILQREGVENPAHKDIISRFLRGERLGRKDLSLHFQFFSGDLNTQPYTP